LSEQVRLLGGGASPPATPFAALSGDALDAAREEAAKEAFKEAIRALGDWHPRVKAAAARSEREAVAAGLVTSPTEALDAIMNGSEPAGAAKTACRGASAYVGCDVGSGEGTPLEAEAEGEEASQTETDSEVVHDEQEESDEEDHVVDVDSPEGSGLQVFHGSSKDPFFQFSDAECIAMGGGTSFALYLEKDLLHGMSEASSTFGSGQLASTQNFVISDMECWVFDDPTEVRT